MRSDGKRLALAIEGGGMAGTVSAGMCVALEALGLIDSFDAIYGASAGAMNASYTAAGQAAERSKVYLLAAQRGLIEPRRAVVGRPPFRLAEIFNSLFTEHPHAPRALENRPPPRVTAARVEDKTLDVLDGFRSLGGAAHRRLGKRRDPGPGRGRGRFPGVPLRRRRVDRVAVIRRGIARWRDARAGVALSSRRLSQVGAPRCPPPRGRPAPP